MAPKSEVPPIDEAYLFPIRPGEQNFLSGTMGELRPNHFHAGLDIKTQGMQGLEVLATADGYISRIKVSRSGYGNALYVQHPNGTTSVYAHLKRYADHVAQHIREAQYQNESFEIELFPDKDQFKFKRGEVVGYSGNSGSSQAPHLHFEIRDGSQRPLNPLKQGFSEIRDNIPPTVRKVALRTLDSNSRINNQLGRFEFSVIKQGAHYIIPSPISAYGNIGVELLAYDKLNGANNRNGVPCIELLVEGKQVFQQNIERFSFAESRDILVHTDRRQRFAKLYRDDGNQLPFYKTDQRGGRLSVLADSSYQLQINLWDIYNNSSQVLFDIAGEVPETWITRGYRSTTSLKYWVEGNDLVIKAPVSSQENPCITMYANRMDYELAALYRYSSGGGIYIWDLDRGLPDSLKFLDETLDFNFHAIIPGNGSFNFYGEYFDLQARANAFFDTTFLNSEYTYHQTSNREHFTINKDAAPLRKHVNVTLKPQKAYKHRDKTAVYSIDRRGNTNYIGGRWDNDKIQFRTRNWGTFTLLADTVKPEIKAVRINPNDIAFIIRDRKSGIDNFRLEVDGQWVLMNYDYKRNLLWSEKLDPDTPFTGEVELKVVDNMGNISYYSSKL